VKNRLSGGEIKRGETNIQAYLGIKMREREQQTSSTGKRTYVTPLTTKQKHPKRVLRDGKGDGPKENGGGCWESCAYRGGKRSKLNLYKDP